PQIHGMTEYWASPGTGKAVILLVLGQVDGDVTELVPVLGDVVSVFFEDVGAVDDRTDRRVPGPCVDLVVDLPHLEHALGVGRRVVDVGGQVVQCPGIGELGGEGGAQLDDIGHGSTGDRCGDLVLGVRPGDELHIDVNTVFFGEGGVGRIEGPCFVRVRAFHDPDGERVGVGDVAAAVAAALAATAGGCQDECQCRGWEGSIHACSSA